MIIREGEVPYRMAYKQSAQTDRTGFERIAVVGFGLVGASFAAAVRSVHPGTKMLAVDVDARTLQEAVQRGWATEGALPDDPVFERFVREGCDLVVLAAPVDAVEGHLKRLADVYKRQPWRAPTPQAAPGGPRRLRPGVP